MLLLYSRPSSARNKQQKHNHKEKHNQMSLVIEWMLKWDNSAKGYRLTWTNGVTNEWEIKMQLKSCFADDGRKGWKFQSLRIKHLISLSNFNCIFISHSFVTPLLYSENRLTVTESLIVIWPANVARNRKSFFWKKRRGWQLLSYTAQQYSFK